MSESGGNLCKVCGKPIIFGEIYVRDRKNDRPKHWECDTAAGSGDKSKDRWSGYPIDVLPHALIRSFYGNPSRENRAEIAVICEAKQNDIKKYFGEEFILFLKQEFGIAEQ